MMAAIFATRCGEDVTLIESNEKLGKKLFLTGKGRCNITNACEREELFQNIVSNPKFLFSSFSGFDNKDTIEFFENIGLRMKTERGNRVFPISDHSSDVIKVLSHELERLKVKVRLNTSCTELILEDYKSDDNKHYMKRICGVILSDGEQILCERVIMATGGQSYATTGSDGRAFGMLDKELIEVKNCNPSLVPLECRDSLITDMQGLALKNVELTVMAGNKVRFKGFGEMLFTHFGISGPLVLSASSYLKCDDYARGVTATVDLKPALDEGRLDERILRDFAEAMNKNYSNVLVGLVPTKMIPSFVRISGIDGDKKVNLITKEERRKIVSTLKAFPIRIDGNRGFAEAIITRGGVSVKSINPTTMEAKKIKGLFFAGEMIDIDALTGGFNLQIAWSTGHAAGVSGLGLGE